MGCHQVEEQEAELLGKGLERRLQRGPVSSERPCQRGWRIDDLESPETLARLSHLLDGQSHHPAHPHTHAHTERPALSLAFQPRPVQPDLPPASAPPGSKSTTHAAFSPFPHAPGPSHVLFLCLDHPSFFLYFILANRASIFLF